MATKERRQVLIPPVEMGEVPIRIIEGPSFHGIVDSVGVPDFKSVILRSRMFEAVAPLPVEGSDGGWRVGGDSGAGFFCEIVITSLRRIDDATVKLGGHFKTECLRRPSLIFEKPTVCIKYYIKNNSRNVVRTGTMVVSRERYLSAIRANKDLLCAEPA